MSRLQEWSRSPSRTFTVLAAGFCVGIGLGQASVAAGLWAWMCLAAIVAMVPLRRLGVPRLCALAALALSLGALRSAATLRTPSDMPFDREVRVRGRIVGETDQLLSAQRATIADATVDGQVASSRILARFEPYPLFMTDDVVSFYCRLEAPRPIEGFRYDRYLAARGVYAVCSHPSGVSVEPPAHPTVSGLLFGVKRFLVRRLDAALPEPEASFLSGLVFGGTSGLPPDVQDAFSATGTSHVLAASGSNVSLLTALFLGWAMERGWGRRRVLALTVVLLAAYVVMAGAVPAVMRAALMASVLLAGAWTRRQADTANLLLLAAVLMLAASPRLLLDDPGFEMSFAATLALIMLVPHWEPFFAWLPARYGIRLAFVASLAASTLTLPVSLWHFGTVSLIGPLANLLLLPFIPFLVLAGLLAFAAAVIHPVLAVVAGLPAWAGAFLFLRAEQTIAAVPFALVPLPHARLAALAALILVSLLVWRSCRPSAA